MSDEELITLLKDKPTKGYSKLIHQYTNFVYAVVLNQTSSKYSKEDVEECVSDIFYEFYKNREVLDLSKGTLKGFLAFVSKRRAIDLIRKKEALKEEIHKFSYSLEENESLLSSGESIEATIITKENQTELLEAIHKLGVPDSEIMIRKYFYGQSSKEIAQFLQLKPNTVDKKVSRNLVKLKKYLGGVQYE